MPISMPKFQQLHGRSWLVNLKDRCAQLEDWSAEPIHIPKALGPR